MSEDNEESAGEGDEEASDEGKPDNHPVNTDFSGLLAAQKIAEEAIQPAAIQSMAEVEKAMEKAVKPALLRDAVRIQKMADSMTLDNAIFRDAVLMEEMIDSGAFDNSLIGDAIRAQELADAVAPSLAHSAIQAQKIVDTAIQPAYFQSLVRLEQALDSALIQLNAPSITADISTISTTAHRRSSKSSVVTQKHPVTEVDEMRPPETRIHDKLVWDDGEWYRRRTLDLSFHLVNYMFWKAHQAGELTEASDEEVGFGATAAALVITLILTGNPAIAIPVGGAVGGGTAMGRKAARNRNDRVDLDDKFGSDEE